MSELVVGSIAGLSANSFEIDIASGSTLDLANAKAASLPTSAIGAGGILQVVSTAKTDTFTTTSDTFTDVTGLSVSITPKSTSSKIMVLAFVNHGSIPAASAIEGRLLRDSTPIFVGDAAGSRTQATFDFITANSSHQGQSSPVFLDSPATTSSVTYKVQVRSTTSGQLSGVNRSQVDTDTIALSRTASSITLIEVAG